MKQTSALVVAAFAAFALICIAPPLSMADDMYQAAVLQYKAANYKKAAQFFGMFIKTLATSDPRLATANYYMACCYYQMGQVSTANDIYKTIAIAFPQSREAALARDMLSRSKIDLPGAASPPGATVATKSAPKSASSSAEPAESARVLAAALAGALAAQSGSSESPEEKAEFDGLPNESRIFFTKEPHGHMVIDCFLNGHPITAWFDTGASAHFGMNHLRAAGIDLPRGNPIGYTSGWAGKPVPVWAMRAKVRIGNMTRTIPMTVEENMELPPLVGQEFVKGLQYAIDDKANCMTITKAGTAGSGISYNSLYDVPCKHGAQNDYVPIEVNGRKVEVFIDTGASSTVMYPSALQAAGIEIPSDARTVYITGVGGALPVKEVYLNLHLGPIHKDNFRVLVGGSGGSCVGQDFLEGWRFTVDRQSNMLRFFH